METILNMRKEFIISNLRSQITNLLSVLKNLEDAEKIEGEYTNETLKKVELDLRQIRKLCVTN